MENVVLSVHLILALILIGLVLMQRSEGGGLGMGGGGGNATSGRGVTSALAKVTWVLAAAFIATSITLTIIAASKSTSGSVIDQIGGTVPAPEAPAAPLGTGTDLLPPAPADAPATPPRAD
jgi:preprotein translocase subunit SecG